MSNPEAASLCDAARQFAARAISLDTRHQFADAKEAYTNAAESLIKAVSVEPDVRTVRLAENCVCRCRNGALSYVALSPLTLFLCTLLRRAEGGLACKGV